jgi:hypothetical protein
MKKVYIDDSMWGELLGGVIIGFLFVEDGKKEDSLTSEYVDVRFFQGKDFANKIYLDEGFKKVLKVFEQNHVSNSDDIYLCRGYFTSEIGKRLVKLGYHIFLIEITGKLQDYLVSQNHAKLREIINDDDLFKKPGAQFNKLVNWVNLNLNNREKYVKTGWKNWEKWRKK